MNGYHSFAATTVGASHVKSGQICQDFSDFIENDRYCLAVVSDGHGNSKHFRSDRGSKFACRAAMEAVREFADDTQVTALELPREREERLRQLCRSILAKWNQRVFADLEADPPTEEELLKCSAETQAQYRRQEHLEGIYGCTLLISLVTKTYFLALQIGDGDCFVLEEGTFTRPVPPDPDCHDNITSSMCSHNANQKFRWYFTQTLPVAVFISSDGVYNAYGCAENVENLYHQLCAYTRANRLDAEGFDKLVRDTLPKLTSCSWVGDDVSVAGTVKQSLLIPGETATEVQPTPEAQPPQPEEASTEEATLTEEAEASTEEAALTEETEAPAEKIESEQPKKKRCFFISVFTRRKPE